MSPVCTCPVHTPGHAGVLMARPVLKGRVGLRHRPSPSNLPIAIVHPPYTIQLQSPVVLFSCPAGAIVRFDRREGAAKGPAVDASVRCRRFGALHPDRSVDLDAMLMRCDLCRRGRGGCAVHKAAAALAHPTPAAVASPRAVPASPLPNLPVEASPHHNCMQAFLVVRARSQSPVLATRSPHPSERMFCSIAA